MEVTIGISNHHCHLTESVYQTLFGSLEYHKKYDLNQIGEFAMEETITLKNGDKVMNNVRLIGPFRKYNQVELLDRDKDILAVNPPIRKSGDLENSESLTLVGPCGEYKLISGVIISETHIHMEKERAIDNNLSNNQILNVNIKGTMVEAKVKISDNAYYEMHINKDIAEKLNIERDEKAEIII